MGFGDFLRGIAAQVNPFDNGATYGTYNPPKKRQDQFQPQVVRPTPSPGIQTNSYSNTIKNSQSPLDFGRLKINNTVNPANNQQPDNSQPRPYGFWQKAGDIASGMATGVAEVPFGVARAASGAAEGIDQLPALAVKGVNAAANKFDGNTGHWGVTDAIDNATSAVNAHTFDPLNKGIDTAANYVGTHMPFGDKAINQAAGHAGYLGSQVGANVIAGLTGLGELSDAAVASKLADGTRAANILRGVGRSLAPAENGGFVTRVAATPLNVSHYALNAPIRGATKLASRLTPAESAGEAANVAAETTQAPTVTKIPVSEIKTIPVTSGDVNATAVPVKTTGGKLIQEVGGDQSNATTAQQVADERARQHNQQIIDNFENQTQPTNTIQDVTPRKPGDAGYVTGADIQAERDALDQALASKQITKTQYKAANKALDDTKPVDGKPDGRKIEVKQVQPIPVEDKTVVPALDAPQTPGKVRPTTQTAPLEAKSEAAPNPVAVSPAPIPKVGSVLPGGTKVTKRMVQAARNQTKRAKQLAKAKGNTQDVMDNMPELGLKPEGNPGFVPTGEFSRGAHGAYQNVHAATEAAQGAHDAANLSTADVLSKADQEMLQNEQITAETARNLKAKIEDPSIPKNTPEGKALLNAYHEALTRHAQALAIADKVVRRTATGDQIANRFVNKLILMAQDVGKLSEADVAAVKQAENAFTEARDAADAAAEQFKATGSEADYKVWEQAHAEAQAADRQARQAEYLVAKRVLKGNKDPNALKAIQQAEKDSGAYSMDAIDANMLSGTGTMIRNYINTLFPRAENAAFGKVASLATRKLAPVGSGSREGAKLGAKIGKVNFKADAAARKEAGVGFIRRTVTAGNTLGEKNIQRTAYAQAFDHYKQVLARKGYTGSELTNRAKFKTLTDPDGIVKMYEAQALKANALSSLTHSKKIENWLADTIQKKLADTGVGHTGQTVGRGAAKAVTRVGLGFPTVIARSLVEGTKRATVGVPEAITAVAKYRMTGDKEAFAQELSQAIKHAGSGGSLMVLGAALAQAGAISGPYPKDKNERTRWTADGKQPNSINIGGQWFQIPGYLGGFALPLMVGASMGDGNVTSVFNPKEIYQDALDSSPVDNIKSTIDIFTGEASDAKLKNAVTSLVRSMTPVGSFVAELAKLTDTTQNDTTRKSAIMNILDQVSSGVPGVNNLENKTPKTDAYGNVLHNPNPIATFLGAQGANRPQGQQDVQQAQNAANTTYSQLRQNGVIDDKNLMQLVDPKIRAQIQRGEDLTPENVKSVEKAVTKGIGTGISASSDSNWRENGQYATDRAAMQTKLQLLQADPTAKKTDVANLKVQIARDNVLEQNNVPYDVLQLYEKTSVSEWRAMGNAKSDAYDPETYQQLYKLDNLLTKAGGSYRTSDPTKNKYTVHSGSGSGSGSRRAPKVTASFGTLNTSNPMAPKARAYQTASMAGTGNIPVIKAEQPHIVHKIGR